MKDYLKIKNFEEYTKKITEYETQVKIMCNKVRPHNVDETHLFSTLKKVISNVLT